MEEEHYGPNGDSLQKTTTGLMVWRKADNWTAFTNGARSWVNGPNGVQERGNGERFPWEGGYEAVAAAPAPPSTSTCKLGELLPVVPADDPDYPAFAAYPDSPVRPDRAPSNDGTDTVIIMCSPIGPGYRVEMRVFWGSAGQIWTRREAVSWFERHGINSRSEPIEWMAQCRSRPEMLVLENYPDRSCFRVGTP